MNSLAAVFWDYPELTDENRLRTYLHESSAGVRLWVLLRFLERARVADTFRYFGLEEIAAVVHTLRKDSAVLHKWERLLEVYGSTPGR